MGREKMASPASTNGNEAAQPTQLGTVTAQHDVADLAPAVGRPPLAATISLVILVRNEARNIAWVLEQIADDVTEIILVDGDSTDATLITARSYRPDIKVVAQQVWAREARCGPASWPPPATSS